MNILYGVQTTGNGHISKSREVIRNLKKTGHKVTAVLSGREPSLLWDMKDFEPFITYRGITFSTNRGKVRYLDTAFKLNLFQYLNDARSFDASGYDLVITDFEPISARVAKLNRIPSIGIGHQYAFLHDIPLAESTALSMLIIKNFAPVDNSIGLHWHHFGQPILPPIVPSMNNTDFATYPGKILVYLPFEELDDIKTLLLPFKSHDFYVYHRDASSCKLSNLHLRPFSRENFLRDLMESNGVIANAGFEMASEALHLGKRLLVKPLAGQMEQSSNAIALDILKIGMTMQRLDPKIVSEFLKSEPSAPMGYPDVAAMIAEWIGKGTWGDKDELIQKTWAMTKGYINELPNHRAFG